MDRAKAILLIGPTGSGKSPLGALLEKRMGWAHFDFGHELRLIARGEGDFGLTDKERKYVKDLLHDRALFPDDKFHIVEKILTDFLDRNDHTPGVILNGLPRHIGQVEGVANHVDIKGVAVLKCSKKAWEQKFVRFTRRTAPIISHYEGTGVGVVRIPLGNGTNEADIASIIIKAVR